MLVIMFYIYILKALKHDFNLLLRPSLMVSILASFYGGLRLTGGLARLSSRRCLYLDAVFLWKIIAACARMISFSVISLAEWRVTVFINYFW